MNLESLRAGIVTFLVCHARKTPKMRVIPLMPYKVISHMLPKSDLQTDTADTINKS